MKRAIALGTFDGVHPGHRRVLEHPADHSLTVITFDVPPKSFFSGKSELVMTLEDRKNALLKLGAEKTVVLDFAKVRDTEASDFLSNIYREFSPDLILCGFNFRFGRDAKGDTGLISDFCREKGIGSSVAPPVLSNGVSVSSTMIRNLLTAGDIKAANEFIFGGFGFTSTVLHGDRRGREIGFPTVNQTFPDELVKLRPGVYFGRIIIGGKEYDCVSDIGIRPTFRTERVVCESHVFDFSRETYGEEVTLKPLVFLRDEIRFGGIDELKRQIGKDIEAATGLRNVK